MNNRDRGFILPNIHCLRFSCSGARIIRGLALTYDPVSACVIHKVPMTADHIVFHTGYHSCTSCIIHGVSMVDAPVAARKVYHSYNSVVWSRNSRLEHLWLWGEWYVV